MDQGLRPGEGFIKKKSSSGCLIIKKKIAPSGGVTPLPRNVSGSNETRERRSFGGFSVSGSSEESDRLYYGEGTLGNNRFHRQEEFGGDKRRKFDDMALDKNAGMYRKRMRKDDGEEGSGYGISENRNSPYIGTGSVAPADVAQLPVSPLMHEFKVPLDKPIRVQGKNGVLKVMINKSKNVNVLRQFYEKYIEDGIRETAVDTSLSVGSSIYSGLKHSENTSLPVVKENSDPKLQNSLSMRIFPGDSETDGSDFSLKPKLTSTRSYEYQNQQLDTRDLKLEKNLNKNAPVAPVFSPDPKVVENRNLSLKTEKREIELQNLLPKRNKKDKFQKENSDTLLKEAPNNELVGSSSKVVKSEDKTPATEKATIVGGKEAKVKRGTGTEKQLLREKIRHKLVSSGWTINYRPRKNRDYLDAVYINPSGTAYWSIIKAYEAFKKQAGEEDVPEELLNKLTRQTRKKMEKEMKLKQKEEAMGKIGKDVAIEEAEEDTENDDNDEKLSFSKKLSSKSVKRKSEKAPVEVASHMIQEKKTQAIGRSTLLVRSSDQSSKSENDGFVPYTGKRTLLSWLIDSGTICENAEVQYMNRKQTKIMRKGRITGEGILCGCCNKTVTVSKFEIHAGSKLRQPSQNIYLESGKSLLQCQIEAWNGQDKKKRCGFYNLNIDGDDGNDDACGLCGDGGDLMCCDGCPSTFHQSCMGIQELPLGDWHCANCRCKFCERSSGQRSALLTCKMCERKYHQSCKKEIDALSADVDRELSCFCGNKCQEVFNQLQKLLEVKHELEAGFSWSLIHRTDIDTDASEHGFPQKVESNCKLAVALSVMEECFLPITDRRSGINLIHNILYNRGSNYSRLNHSGFYTAILERGDEIIAAASIRIHGSQLAEMPFIGTRHIYRRQGMCRRLLSAIESALSFLKVEKLIIPAIAEDMNSWTGVFGFNPLKKSHKKEMRSLNMFVFPRTEMLQKKLVEQNTGEELLTAKSGGKSVLSIEQQHFMRGGKRVSQKHSSPGDDFNVCDEAKLISFPKTDTKIAATGSCSSAPTSNAKSSSHSSSDICLESKAKDLSKDDIDGKKIKSPNAEEVKEN